MLRKREERWYVFSLVTQLGFSLVIPLVLGIGGGVWLDKKLLTSPLFTLSGLVAGLVVSAYSFYIEILPLIKNKKR